MKPQSKPFLVEIKSSRRTKRTHAKPNWPEIKRADSADKQSKNDSTMLVKNSNKAMIDCCSPCLSEDTVAPSDAGYLAEMGSRIPW